MKDVKIIGITGGSGSGSTRDQFKDWFNETMK